MPRAGFAEILRLLARSEVELIVVGMTAGVLQGAARPDDVARLLAALRSSAPSTSGTRSRTV